VRRECDSSVNAADSALPAAGTLALTNIQKTRALAINFRNAGNFNKKEPGNYIAVSSFLLTNAGGQVGTLGLAISRLI